MRRSSTELLQLEGELLVPLIDKSQQVQVVRECIEPILQVVQRLVIQVGVEGIEFDYAELCYTLHLLYLQTRLCT